MEGGLARVHLGAEFNPPIYFEGRVRDLFPEFLYCVVAPGAALVLLILVLSCLMCCSRGGTKKRTEMTPDTQLVRYNSIKRATANIRRMSLKRDQPLLPSGEPRSVSADYDMDATLELRPRGRNTCHSAPGTLQRDRNRDRSSQNPPGYRLPPRYSDDMGIGRPVSGIEDSSSRCQSEREIM